MLVEVGDFSKRVGNFKHKFLVEGDINHEPLSVSDKYSNFMWYQNIGSMVFRFVTKHACQTVRITIFLPHEA